LDLPGWKTEDEDVRQFLSFDETLSDQKKNKFLVMSSEIREKES
jgi:hypothetical protein